MEKNFLITEITRVIMVGKEEYPQKKTVFFKASGSNEIIFNFSGQYTAYYNDEVLENTPGTVRFLPEGKFFRYEIVRDVPGDCIDIYFKTDRPISDKALVINPSQKEKVGSLFNKIFSKWVGQEDGYYFECMSLLYKIFSVLQSDRYSPKQRFGIIDPAVEYINSNFLRVDLSTKALASLCNISESYFNRIFRQRYGISPRQYIIRRKINHACDLLKLEQYNITQIAEICNYSDVYFFSKQFKEYIGITPTQFIKKYKSSK